VLLSDVDGLYDGNPEVPTAQVIPVVAKLDESVFALCRDRATGLSKGGMASKLNAARIVTSAGENAIIASGRRPNVLVDIVNGLPVGTLFLAQGQAVQSRKRWIGHATQTRGALVLDAGARRAVAEQGRSLLAIGVVGVEGEFVKGDIVALRGPDGTEFARGLTNYASGEIARIQGLKTDQIAAALGHCPYDEVIHRNNLTVAG
jgi:glutamate 5-kinase